MGQNIVKGKVGKWGIGAVLVLLIMAGILLIGRQPGTTPPVEQKAVAMKIPKKPASKKIKPVEPIHEEAGPPMVVTQSSGTAVEPPALEPEIPEAVAPEGVHSEMTVAAEKEESEPVEVVTQAAESPEEAAPAEPFNQPENTADARPAMETEAGGIVLSPQGMEGLKEESVTMSPKPEAAETAPAVPKKKKVSKPGHMVSRQQANLPEKDQNLMLHDVRLSENLKGKILEIWANTQIGKYKYFILSNPPRLVIDLPGNWEALKFQRKALNDRLVSGVRLWRHPEKLRIVCDLVSENKAIKPVVTPNSEGVEFLLVTE